MKNICITKSNNKFNNNILAYQQDAQFIEIDPAITSIYKNHYLYNEAIQTYIINASKISEETLSFIQEFNETVEFIIYFDIFLENLYNLSKPIVKKVIVDHNVDLEGAIKLPEHIVNDIIYTNTTSCKKIDQMIYFIDNDNELPLGLQSALYPNTKLKIKMFNSPIIKHPQNLGFANEFDKKELLSESSIYCYSNPNYIAEASICGCKVLDVSEFCDPDKAQTLKVEYTTYGKFLKDNIL
jgi:hypothetical protein